MDPEFRQQSRIIAANLVRLRTEQAALEKESERLTLRAPIDGEITDVSLDLSIGQWFGTGQRIVAIKKTSGIKVTGYVEEEDIFRVHKTGSCRFFSPGASFNSLPCNVSVVGKSAEISLEMPMLATSRGGNISASIVGTTLVPDQAIYKITAIINELDLPINRQTMGMLKLDADRKSLVERFWRWAVAVLIRESGT